MENNTPEQNNNVIGLLIRKATLKQEVYTMTLQKFLLFKQCIREIVEENQKTVFTQNRAVVFEYLDKGEFEVEFRFGSDVLIFLMHSNIFEFSRDHEVMKTSYVKEDSSRSYCGMITIFNFLGDSFKYNRLNDIGYLIGRIFLNREQHYFVEGKREIGMLYNNFQNAVLDKNAIRTIIESAMLYTINFDLLTPPYDAMKEVTVAEMQTTLANMPVATGKRLGFRFNADTDISK